MINIFQFDFWNKKRNEIIQKINDTNNQEDLTKQGKQICEYLEKSDRNYNTFLLLSKVYFTKQKLLKNR